MDADVVPDATAPPVGGQSADCAFGLAAVVVGTNASVAVATVFAAECASDTARSTGTVTFAIEPTAGAAVAAVRATTRTTGLDARRTALVMCDVGFVVTTSTFAVTARCSATVATGFLAARVTGVTTWDVEATVDVTTACAVPTRDRFAGCVTGAAAWVTGAAAWVTGA
ncbi:hypothetical protein, partial [uncultured Jatrophihabitans sp.]|uniref:hypothetical protein n=1 Tax=uncultured Jatrophihabitans sp. TaxID=1610747 RepID=UPI0035CC21E5